MIGALSSFRPSGEMAAPHLASLETLALAIEVQGSHAPGHLLRCRLYAGQLARRLGLDQAGQELLQLAAVFHDLGELAVPRSILFKASLRAGDLTPQESEKMKIHASVGASMVERAGLPRAAADMVRSHHERWDGTGYPDGLRQNAIPLGARILAVADCLAGTAATAMLRALWVGNDALFDPRIVQVAVEDHDAIERAVEEASAESLSPDFRSAIGAAWREERVLCQLIAELGNSLSLPETISGFDRHLSKLIAYDCIALYQVKENRLSPAYVNGANSQLFSSLEIPWGEGPSGIAAATGEAVLNGDPQADTAHSQALPEATTLRSTLAIALESGGEPIAVLALYHAAPEAFSGEDLRVLQAIRAKLASAVAHALQQERADRVASVDTLTGLPNRRALFGRLDAELARCRRNRATMALLVCEIDGLSRIHRQSGAAASNPLCKAIALGLRQICREDDCVARMGEGFVLALGGFSAHDLAEKRYLIESLLAGLAPPEADACPLVLRIGAAYYPNDGSYAEDLLACADLRLNGAQSSGRL